MQSNSKIFPLSPVYGHYLANSLKIHYATQQKEGEGRIQEKSLIWQIYMLHTPCAAYKISTNNRLIL